MAVTAIADLFTRAQARLMIQYKTLTKFVADVGVLIAEVQQLEDTFNQFEVYLDLDNATGVWLDRAGKIDGYDRDGLDDDDYIAIQHAKIKANISDGTTEAILGVANGWIGPTVGGTLLLVDWYPAAQALTLGAVISDPALLTHLFKLLNVARAVAVQTMVLWQPLDDAHSFEVGDADGIITIPGLGFDDAASPNQPTAGGFAGALNTTS